MFRHRLFASLLAAVAMATPVLAQEPTPALGITLNTNGQPTLELPLLPAIDAFTILSSPNLDLFQTNLTGEVNGYTWLGPLADGSQFFNVQITPMSSNAVLSATLLNRLAYGQTPDELDRLAQIGPQAYIDEQLAPETIAENLDVDEITPIQPGWEYVSVTGRASSSRVYISIDQEGVAYIDDLAVVRGTNAAGVNLLKEGAFEAPLSTNVWVFGEDFGTSHVSTERSHTGASSLKLIATDDGGGSANSVNQIIVPSLVNNQTYTISYWFWRDTNQSHTVTVRLSGSGIVATSSGNYSPATLLKNRLGKGEDLRTLHTAHALRSKKQLLEVLLQFLENHFVTQMDKTEEYFDRYYDGDIRDRIAAELEYRELEAWRAALLKPDVTFYDLLKISAESPAMIVYLDTVDSKGNGSNVANENYARELLELFTFGVDNGYDQNDIVAVSRAWTGWSVRLVSPTNLHNPFALQSTTRIPGASSGSIRNLQGVWALNYKQGNHYTPAKAIFPGKTVPARFGEPYAGRAYELLLPSRTGTNGMTDGYAVIQHLANQPFTQEYMSVKLCRVFVHEGFEHGYDFTDPNLSAEGQLIRECMRAWESGTPKGQLRDVLRVIFNSDLFRTQAASMQKIKTPFEFTISAIRALRADNGNGGFTATLTGDSLRDPMEQMGDMDLFNRAEPDGYPESGASWISSGTLAERLRFVQGLVATEGSVRENAGAGNSADPVALLRLKLPQTQWADPDAIARYFLSILYPAEGRANVDLYRQAAINYLNTADDGVTPSPFATVSITSTTHQTRVRGMVAMLMTLPRFQEQ